MQRKVTYAVVTAVFLMYLATAFCHQDSVRLGDIDVLTLRQGYYTTGRRSAPVPQLTCVGGSAKGQFTPQTVQCYNRGSDGYDIQWECKADMDNAYRFGEVSVTCEGYDHPRDHFVLKGSCGLEYTLELTEEGKQRQPSGNGWGWNSGTGGNLTKGKASSVIGDLVALSIVALIVYGVYKMFSGPSRQDGGPTPRDPHQPPPPGFRSEYTPGGCGSDDYTHSQRNSNTGYMGTGNTGGGFWSGAGLGGLLGYLWGSSRNTYTQYQDPYNSWWGGSQYGRSRRGYGWGSGWGSGWGNSWGSNWGSGSTGSYSPPRTSSSSGTRTASGFGGTKRR